MMPGEAQPSVAADSILAGMVAMDPTADMAATEAPTTVTEAPTEAMVVAAVMEWTPALAWGQPTDMVVMGCDIKTTHHRDSIALASGAPTPGVLIRMRPMASPVATGTSPTGNSSGNRELPIPTPIHPPTASQQAEAKEVEHGPKDG